MFGTNEVDKKLLLQAIVLLALIGILQAIGSYYKLYWNVWWFDIFMHTLGGFFAGISVILLYRKRIIHISLSGVSRTPIATILGVLIIGAVWEGFEYFTGLTFTEAGYIQDTFTDLIMDVLGAIIAWKYVMRLQKVEETQNE